MAKSSGLQQLLRAVALAMGIAVVVLRFVHSNTSTQDLVLLLGLGLFCEALASF